MPAWRIGTQKQSDGELLVDEGMVRYVLYEGLLYLVRQYSRCLEVQ